MFLWLILVVTVVVSLSGLSVSLSPEARETTRVQLKNSSRRVRWGCAGLVSALLLSVAWVGWAFESGDWRYAAIGVAPFVCSVIRVTVRREWQRDSEATLRRRCLSLPVVAALPPRNWPTSCPASRRSFRLTPTVVICGDDVEVTSQHRDDEGEFHVTTKRKPAAQHRFPRTRTRGDQT